VPPNARVHRRPTDRHRRALYSPPLPLPSAAAMSPTAVRCNALLYAVARQILNQRTAGARVRTHLSRKLVQIC
jgi:hypothetical protein